MINISLIKKEIYKFKDNYYKVINVSKLQNNYYVTYTYYLKSSNITILEKLDDFLQNFTPITPEDKIELL